MPIPYKHPDEVMRDGLKQFGGFIPVGARQDVKDRLSKIASYDEYVAFLQEEVKLPEDLAQTTAGTVLYGFLEKFGIDPAEWMLTVKPLDRENIKYGPEEYEEARKFLGSWTRIAEIALFVASIAAIAVALIGGGLAAGALATIGAVIRKGGSKLAITTLLNLVKLRGIKWLALPSAILAVATGWSFFANTQIMATGDLQTYIKQGVARGEEQLRKLEAQRQGLLAGAGAGGATAPKVIIRMVEEKKPEQFIGTLFSAKLGSMESFNRHIDDEITDEDDLREDIKINLNRWLASLPGRLGYSVVIRKDPVDEQGVKQSGLWATLTTHFTRLSGPIQPIDTILLGPVSPATRLKLSKTIKTIQQEIPGILKGQEIVQVEVPGGVVDIFDTSGAHVDLSTPRIPTAPAPTATTTAPATTTPPTSTATPFFPTPTGEAPPIPQPEPTEAPITTTPAPTLAITTQIPGDVAAAKWGSTPTVDAGGTICAQTCGPVVQGVNIKQHQIVRVDTGGSVLHLRNTPGTSSIILDKLPDGTLMRVNNSRGVVDGHLWLDVSVPAQADRTVARAGFVASEFVAVI